MSKLVELLYARPGDECVEVCVQDDAGYRIHSLPYTRALNLARSILNLVKFNKEGSGDE